MGYLESRLNSSPSGYTLASETGYLTDLSGKSRSREPPQTF